MKRTTWFVWDFSQQGFIIRDGVEMVVDPRVEEIDGVKVLLGLEIYTLEPEEAK